MTQIYSHLLNVYGKVQYFGKIQTEPVCPLLIADVHQAPT